MCVAWTIAAGALFVAGLNASADGAAANPQGSPILPGAEQRESVLTTYTLRPGPLQGDPAFIESMLARYVEAREGFDGLGEMKSTWS